MKVLFVSNNYIPYQSGVTRSIQATIHGLQKHSIEVKLLVPDYRCNVIDPNYVLRVPALVSFLYKGNYLPVLYRRKHFMHSVVQEFKPDIIHVHHPFILGVDALKVAQKYNIPVIFTFHTQYDRYLHYIPGITYLSRQLLWRYLAWFCRQVDMIVFPSVSLQRIVNEYIRSKNSIVLPSPIAPEFFTASKNESIYTTTKINLLYVGRFVPEKNIPFLLNVEKELGQDYCLTLAGYGYSLPTLKKYAYDTLQLTSDQVVFIDHPTKSIIVDLYRTAEIFIFASQTETQGLVLAEAMACGLPVIALYGCGVVDIVLNGANGYIVHTQEEMVTRIKELTANTYLKEHMKEKAIETSLLYDPDAITRKLLQCYEQILKFNT